ncbi:DUF4190 domain-containing protein [Streptomyces sp. NPDC006332]|uniref:DUF4190 domain-containing protein n=1 Tax=Streptomyces sp. NPDC006332 TaxID=3155456 RepID=UPI0033A0582F
MSIPPPPGAPQPQEPQGPYPQGQYPPGPGPGPYGPYGPPPYQTWGQGYSPYARPAPVNALAVASLVLGILCCVPAVGLVLGLVALGQIRRKGERGRSMAITGSVLSSLGLALWIVALATGALSDAWEGFKEGARGNGSLSRGECFDAPDGLQGAFYDLDEVPCADRHDGEVFAVVKVPGGRFPGDDEVSDMAGEKCYPLRSSYAMDTWALPADVDVYFIVPSADSWHTGDRDITCAFGNTDERGSLPGGSLHKDQAAFDADQIAYLKAANLLDAALDSAPVDAPEDDLAAHTEWAGEVSDALTEEVGLLRDHTWPADVREPVDTLVRDLEALEKPWAEAADAQDVDAFYQHYDDAIRLDDPDRSVSTRKALGLATTPPSSDGDGGGKGNGDGDGKGDGGGDSGLDV